MSLALVAAAYAATVVFTGGFEIELGPLTVSSHNAVRPAAVASLAFILFLLVDHRASRRALATGWRHADTPAAGGWLALAAGVWTLSAGILFNTYAAGGSDSYGYLSQALLFSRGALTERIDRRPEFNWTNAEESLIPLGYVRAAEPDLMAPFYPPGLPLLMALLRPLGHDSMFVVVPFFGVLSVVLLWQLGTRLGEPMAGGVAAVLLAASPIFLYQLVQPMSDVPATACWLAALLASSTPRPGLAGVCAGLAILIRPNLAPLAFVVAMVVARGSGSARNRRLAAFAVPAVLAVGALMWMQHVRYGSPFESGYGPLDQLFGKEHIVTNLRQYSTWLTSSQTPLVWAALAAPVLFGRLQHRGLAWAMAAFVLGMWASYLPYVAFQSHEWHYARFLLPALALMLLFAVVVVVWCVRFLAAEASVVLLTILVLAVTVSCGRYALDRGVFRLKEVERKYLNAGTYAREKLPPSTWTLAVQHSGSLRLYAGTPTLRWDFVVAEEIDRVVATLRGAGFVPMLVGDPDEIVAFRSRFEGSEAVRTMTLSGRAEGTHFYRFE